MKYNMNQLVFLNSSKDVARISNGIEQRNIDTNEMVFIPTECIVHRFVGTDEHGRALIAYTYIKCDVNNISEYAVDSMADVDKIRPCKNFIGRI